MLGFVRKVAIRRGTHRASVCIMLCLVLIGCGLVSSAGGQSASLETIRDYVRSVRQPSSFSLFKRADPETDEHHDYQDSCDSHDADPEDVLGSLGAGLLFCAVVSPFYIPNAMLGDSSEIHGFFPRFPYDHAPGYMVLEDSPGQMFAEKWARRPRRWSGRMRLDYCDDFDALDRIGYHLLLSTSSRFGIETEMDYLQEQLPIGMHDQLWLGDCNFTYRFAQSAHMQWRAGLGFNWLDDKARTDFGFNFTYGFDFFPKKPWVFSSTLDWGTVGSAELFRFRATGGIVIHGIEGFLGYEYFDLDRTQLGGLIAGLRLWF